MSKELAGSCRVTRGPTSLAPVVTSSSCVDANSVTLLAEEGSTRRTRGRIMVSLAQAAPDSRASLGCVIAGDATLLTVGDSLQRTKFCM